MAECIFCAIPTFLLLFWKIFILFLSMCLSVVMSSSVSMYVFVLCLDVCCSWLLSSACRLVDALRDFGYLDWQFSALVRKTLWNYSGKMTSSLSCFGAEETELLIEQLEVYLLEELRMCVSLSACMCVCMCLCVCVCACGVCVHMHASMRPIVQRYTLLSVCSFCPADEELAVESVPEGVLKRQEHSSMTCGGVSSVL